GIRVLAVKEAKHRGAKGNAKAFARKWLDVKRLQSPWNLSRACEDCFRRPAAQQVGGSPFTHPSCGSTSNPHSRPRLGSRLEPDRDACIRHPCDPLVASQSMPSIITNALSALANASPTAAAITTRKPETKDSLIAFLSATRVSLSMP